MKKLFDLAISAEPLRISKKGLIVFPTPVITDPGFAGCGRNHA